MWTILVLGLLGGSSVALTAYSHIAQIRPQPNVYLIGIAPPCVKFLVVGSPILYYHITVFILTFAKTYRHTIEMRKIDLQNGLAYYILRDVCRFRVNMLVSVSAVIMNLNHFWRSTVVYVGSAITMSIISRLVLNLRSVAHMQVNNVAIRTITLEPEFATNSLLGNLGAPLRIDAEDEFIMEIQEHPEAHDSDI
ncbi:hypothetical protein BD410DRAFT_804754 [Rickenella mellea]|uniref:Uncharacterized protein n=1 Tax=Rickenella mellea TaxID=50990 RepID=A0A4Y7PZN2_9AGAM|nr:hypothetical protein BD410DRAFT_804754 [Rickenella mellea]